MRKRLFTRNESLTGLRVGRASVATYFHCLTAKSGIDQIGLPPMVFTFPT